MIPELSAGYKDPVEEVLHALRTKSKWTFTGTSIHRIERLSDDVTLWQWVSSDLDARLLYFLTPSTLSLNCLYCLSVSLSGLSLSPLCRNAEQNVISIF
jgi:hypothetical protein